VAIPNMKNMNNNHFPAAVAARKGATSANLCTNTNANKRRAMAMQQSNKKTTTTTTVSTTTSTKKKNTPKLQDICFTFGLDETQTQTKTTYVGPQGYTLFKKEWTEEQLETMRQVLTVRPISNGIGASIGGPDLTFPIYRESANKMYMPRFFGMRHFGVPHSLKIGDGDPISVPFVGSLRPIQVPVVETYLRAVRRTPDGGGGCLELPCAFGKTVLSLNIIASLGVKTLVIVNKEFLLNQWVSRMEQFLPTARIGRIQGPLIDIEGKDIVLGMLQSISMKDYDVSVFSSFGLTIIDEVHHISSEVFSRALFKIVTKYMLGLSATMERKDGTTEVFKQFLGPVVFKGDRDEQHPVEVRAIDFVVSRDPVFQETEYDYRGNPKYSTMISKVSAYTDRSLFILRILADLVEEQPGAQIMVLAHNRALLTYLGDALQRNLTMDSGPTYGYYVGGMKEAALNETEEKQIVLATFAMAAEALDIKTLSTLVMVTPKTDIVQSVGRILRMKHKQPIVVDLVDMHDVFQKQWIQRRRYYKKCGYAIKQVASPDYRGFLDMGHWRIVNKGSNHHHLQEDHEQVVNDCFNADEDDGEDAAECVKKRPCLISVNPADWDNFST